MTEYEAPYHLLGIFSMTRALWVFLFAQLALQLFAAALCFVPTPTAESSGKLVRGNIIALISSVAVSGVTVIAGFVQSFAAHGPDRERAAQLATGLLTVINGCLMAVPFATISAALLWLQYARRTRQATVELPRQAS